MTRCLSEDWDYQDFSPDKRRALLEEQVVADATDDLRPETDAIRYIQDARQQQLNWSGLSLEDALAEYVPLLAAYLSDLLAVLCSSHPPTPSLRSVLLWCVCVCSWTATTVVIATSLQTAASRAKW